MGVPVRQAMPPRPVVPVIFGNSNVGSLIAQAAIRRGHRVMVTSRHKCNHLGNRHIQYIHTPEKHFKDEVFWRDLARNSIAANEHALVINTIGASIIEKGRTAREVNVDTPLTAIKGFTQGLEGCSFNVVQLSTVVADGVQADYGRTKRIMEEVLIELPIENLMILRAGGIISPAIKGLTTQFIKAHNRLSPEELGLFPLSFVIADSPGHVKAPIVAGDDLAKGILNSVEFPGRHLINAVNSEMLTLEEILSFYRTLYNGKFRPIYVPTEAAARITKHVTFGHFNPYTVEFCAQGGKHYSHVPFQALLGHSLKTLREMYQLAPKQKLIVAKPPIFAFAKKLAETYWNNPKIRPDFHQAARLTVKAWLTKKPQEGCARFKTTSEERFNTEVEGNRAIKV